MKTNRKVSIMQREIKFRVWDGDSLEMVEGGVGIDISGVAYVDNPLNGDFTYYPDCPVMQYTGLKDKNGKDVYEGHIVKITHPYKSTTWTGEIVYEEYGFNGKGFYFPHFDEPGQLFSEGTEYIEVIGNIYENSELLKEEK